MAEELPALLADVEAPSYCRNGLPIELNLWISGPRTFSRLHFDQPHNLLAEVAGEKRAILIPASERRFVYPSPLGSAAAQFSRVDLRAPDLARFPALRRAHPLEGVVRPGDALFIPGGHWHYLEAEEATISVGIRWWPWTRLPLLLAADAYKRLRGHTR
jgi:lysine-specific demethylase 8